MDTVEMDERLADADREVEKGFTADQAHEESKRCYLCKLKYEIDPLTCIYCSACSVVAPEDCIKMVEAVPILEDGIFGTYEETGEWDKVASITIDNENCIRCGNCVAVCPINCISVTKTELMEIDS